MARSKYIADQAVEAARLCVLKASEAEREAMVAKQEAESLNNRFVVQAGRKAAGEGYKAAQAGQNATVVGQQTAVWEDPNLPPKDTVRQLEYVARLIESVVDKAAEVAYKAAQMAQNLGKVAFLERATDMIVDKTAQIMQDLGREKPEAEDTEAQLQKRIQAHLQELKQEYDMETRFQERAGKQTDLKRRVQLSTRRLANILANHDMSDNRKYSSIKEEAQDIFFSIEEAKGTATPDEKTARIEKSDKGCWNLLIPYAVMLASQQVTLANYICALVASRLPRTFLNFIKKKRDTTFCRDGSSYINDIFAYSEISIKCMEIFYTKISKKTSHENASNPIIDINIRKMEDKLNNQLPKGGQTGESDTQKSKPQLIDEKAAQVAQAMDVAIAKIDELIRKNPTIAEADESPHPPKPGEDAGLENLMDQLSTLASRVAILAHQERIVVWGEDSEEEKKDDPQVLEAVALQVDKIANEASQAAEYASQAAKRAGQSVTQLMPDLNKSFQISNRLTQDLKWYMSVSSEVRKHIKSACSEIGSSLDEIHRRCQEADTACKEARNVYEKIEQARRDAEQFCKKGIIAAQSVSWWPIWPGRSRQHPPASINQLMEVTKQSSEAVDQVGQAAVLAGQAVAQSGQAVTQASVAVAILGKVITRHPDSNSPHRLRTLQKKSLPLNQIIPVAQQVGASVVRAGQMAAQASQAANNVALAAQTAQKMTKIAQAVQQVEWLARKRQKWIFGLGMILPLVAICMLIILSILLFVHQNNSTLHWVINWIIIALGIGAIVDSYLLVTSLVENIKKMAHTFHRLLTLFCCALLAGAAIFYTFLIWIIPNNVEVIVSSDMLSIIALVSFIILLPFITGIVYYQHCTLNNLHPHEIPTSALES